MKNLVARTIATALAVLAFCVAASAQAKPAKSAAAPQTKQDNLQALRQNFIQSAEEYRASLQALATSYEDNMRKTEARQEALKGLLADGLITRVEFERSSKAVEEAQSKLDEVRKQIAEADVTIAAARKPVEVLASPADQTMLARVEPKWTTGNAKVDGLIRTNAKRYGIDPYLVYCV